MLSHKRMKRNVAFTICANNYLAHASVLAQSFKSFHPDVHFILAILDESSPEIDYDKLPVDEIIWVHKELPSMVNELKDTYGIAELCTVVKPPLIELIDKKGYECILYIDPDIQIFSEFAEVFEALRHHQAVLTPHICSPTSEKGHPIDKDLMRTGIYNLGFVALRMTDEVRDFVIWWKKRVQAYGYHDLKKGFFYDQIWWGYGPAFLDDVCVLRNLGYNAANWNLHERKVIKKDETFYINDTDTPLRFFHYSHYKMENRPMIASYNQNFDLNNRPDIVPVFDGYDTYLDKMDYQRLRHIPFSYGKKPASSSEKDFKPAYSRLGNIKFHVKQSLRQLILGERKRG